MLNVRNLYRNHVGLVGKVANAVCVCVCVCQTEAGYKALFVSVDLPVLGNRINEVRNNFSFPPHLTFPNIQDGHADLMGVYGAGYGKLSGYTSVPKRSVRQLTAKWLRCNNQLE